MHLSLPNLNHKIIATKALQTIQNEIDQLKALYKPEDILVLFDIDSTICQVIHSEYHPKIIEKYLTERSKDNLKITAAQLDVMANIAILSADWILVDPQFPKFINNLQKSSIKTIALTASLVGKLEKIERVEIERYKRLKGFGIDFSHSFGPQSYQFTQIPTYLGNLPILYNGILCSNGEKGASHNKGHALEAFMNAFNYQPKAIILVDDKIKNIHDVGNAVSLIAEEIGFIGVEYSKVHDLPFNEMSLEDFLSFWRAMANRSKTICS